MKSLSRRHFLSAASAAALVASVCPGLEQEAFAASHAAPKRKRVYVASLSETGLLAYHWDPLSAELLPAGSAAPIQRVAWVAANATSQYLFTASELSDFQGKPTGEVASFRQLHGELTPISTANSAGAGTCQVALDHTGRVLVSVDYAGGSAASFRVRNGELSEIVWQQRYSGHGPNAERQASAHAHFANFSPDNRFVYINDLGSDRIHIYRLNPATAVLTPAGDYTAAPGSGPRTLRFHPNNRTAYSVNELASTVDLLDWNRADGSLSLVRRIELLPAGYTGPTRGCDTVLTRDGRFAYFANRDNNFLYSFRVDPRSGALEPIKRSNCGGNTPRHFTLDPTERWMLVANQDSNRISVFARNPETGELAEESKNFAAPAPMRILFT